MLVIGIDPSLRNTGFSLLEKIKGKIRVVDFGHFPNPPRLSEPECLHSIYEKMNEVLDQYAPGEAAMEEVIFVQSYQTAIKLGGARGVILLALEQHKIPVSHYPAKSIKKSMTGWGGAKKDQIGFMARAVFGLTRTPTADEADAIAISHALNIV